MSCPFPPSVAVVLAPDELHELLTIGETVAATASVDPFTVADTLLADARAVYWPAECRAPDHPRAVLLAAIAAEVRVKAALLELASPEHDALVRVVIYNPRDITQSVPQLLHKTLDAITGRSLHRGAQGALKSNRVAHDAYLPTAEEGRDAVRYPRLLFDWLDELIAERRQALAAAAASARPPDITCR